MSILTILLCTACRQHVTPSTCMRHLKPLLRMQPHWGCHAGSSQTSPPLAVSCQVSAAEAGSSDSQSLSTSGHQCPVRSTILGRLLTPCLLGSHSLSHIGRGNLADVLLRMALHTWNQAIDAQPGHGWAALLVGAVYAVPILIVCCVVKGDLLPVLWPRPRALLKVLQQASSTAVSCCPWGLGHCQPDSAGL